jgi:RNA polymerase primary sigma factor
MRQLKITQSITNRESQSLDKYLTEIAKVDLITAEEEVILTQKIRAGDQVALERLAKANLRFVVSVAKQYQNQGLTLGDLINEGNLGLIKAAGRFDETKGFKFISYAVWWIRQAILTAVAEQSRIVRLPLNQVGSLNKIRNASSKLEQRFERAPTPEEVAEDLEVSVDKITDSMSNAGRHISMDAPFIQGEDNTLLDVLQNSEAGTDSELMMDSLSQEIRRSLGSLAERERDVLVLLFGLNGGAPHSLEEIGEKYELTRERVRQIKDKALTRLRQGTKSKLLQSYL